MLYIMKTIDCHFFMVVPISSSSSSSASDHRDHLFLSALQVVALFLLSVALLTPSLDT